MATGHRAWIGGADDLTNLVTQLVRPEWPPAGPASTGRAASIRVHGRGPLSDLLVQALRGSGARIGHSSQPHATVTSATVDLVVLSDYLVADPRIVRDLHSRASRTCRYGFGTAPGWSARWLSPA